MGFEGRDGRPGPAMHMGTQTGLTPSSLVKDYNRLGQFLHARKPDGQPHDEEKLRRSVEKVIASLERYRDDTIIADFAERHQFSCRACGRKILRRRRALDLNPFVRCPNKDCRAIHERIREDGGEYLFRMVQEHFRCPDCGIGSFFDQHLLQPGARIRCHGCSKEFDLRMVVVPSSQEG